MTVGLLSLPIFFRKSGGDKRGKGCGGNRNLFLLFPFHLIFGIKGESTSAILFESNRIESHRIALQCP